MKPLGTAKIVINGRITIPKEFREEFKWKDGDLLIIYSDGAKIIVEKMR